RRSHRTRWVGAPCAAPMAALPIAGRWVGPPCAVPAALPRFAVHTVAPQLAVLMAERPIGRRAMAAGPTIMAEPTIAAARITAVPASQRAWRWAPLPARRPRPRPTPRRATATTRHPTTARTAPRTIIVHLPEPAPELD